MIRLAEKGREEMSRYHKRVLLCAKNLRLLFLGTILFLGSFWLSTVPAQATGFPIIGVLHSGGHPEALAVDQTTHRVYIAYEAPGSVVCFEPNSGKVCWRTAMGDGVTDLQVDSSSHTLFVTSTLYRANQSYLTILNGVNGQQVQQHVIGTGENSIAFDARQHRVYASSQQDGKVYNFLFPAGWQDAKSIFEVREQKVGSQPGALAVNTRLGRVYVADRQENVLRVYDEAMNQLISTIPIGAVPLPPMRVDEQTGRIFLLCSTAQELVVIDGNHNKMIAEAPVGPYPEGLAIQTNTGRIYVADEGDNEAGRDQHDTGSTISVLDGQSYELLGTMQVGTAPDGVEADAGLRRVYVSVEDTNAVVEISDSINLPLQTGSTIQQRERAQHFAEWLRLAGWLTLIGMIITITLTTLGDLLPQRRGREIPQTQPESGSSRSEQHTLQP
jgi:DNA-binding beta-propeller fold protein YncE